MSKLSQIIDAAEADSVPVASLLRMTKTLASRTQAVVLDDWIDNELSGYPLGAPIPAYRGPIPVEVLAEWSGPGGSILRNAPIAPSAVPQGLRDAGAFAVEFRESVSELERLAQSDSTLSYSWGADTVGMVNREIMEGRLKALARSAPMHGLVKVNRLISPARAGAVVDNVRTRVLTLALDLERVIPDAGEPGITLEDPATVNNIVNIIWGHGNTLAVDSPNATQLAGVQAVRVNDLESLLNAAAAVGLAPENVTELRQAIEGDAADSQSPKGKPGSRVAQFLGKLTLGTLKTAGQTGVQEGAKALTKMILTYYYGSP